MKYKLMAVDVDGTLLNSSNKLTEKLKKAVRKAVANGLVFVISSGRPYQGIAPLSNELQINDMPVITYNGAVIVEGKTREVIYNRGLEAEDAIKVVKLGIELNTTVIVWSEDRLYASIVNEKAKKYSEMSGIIPKPLVNFQQLAEKGITKVLWYDEIETISNLQGKVGEFISGSFVFHTSKPCFLEFVHTEATKSNAMKNLGNIYNIDRTEMIAVGDGANDISMIKFSGVGVAMGNANDEVKQHADFITLSNNEDGVAYVIEKFVL